MRLPYKPRWLNALYAHLSAHFWLPCSLCGEKYGGHEPHGHLDDGPWGGHSVCRNCKQEAEKRNQKLYETPEYKRALSAHYSNAIKLVYPRR